MTTSSQLFFDKFQNSIELTNADGSYKIDLIFKIPSKATNDYSKASNDSVEELKTFLQSHYKNDSAKCGPERDINWINVARTQITLEFTADQASHARENTSNLMASYFKAKQAAAKTVADIADFIPRPTMTSDQRAPSIGIGNYSGS